ncbi:hypothetical protein [Ruegeria sp. HKCCD4884]
MPLSSAIFYVFICWGALIVIGLIFGFAARRIPTPEDQDTGVE